MDEIDHDDVIANRRIAVQWANDAASRGHPLAGALASLELASSPFYLGIDEDSDDSDLQVWP